MSVQISRQNQNVIVDTTLSEAVIVLSALLDLNAQTKLGSHNSAFQVIGAPLALQSVPFVMQENSVLIQLVFLPSVHMAQLQKQDPPNARLARKVLSVTHQMAQ